MPARHRCDTGRASVGALPVWAFVVTVVAVAVAVAVTTGLLVTTTTSALVPDRADPCASDDLPGPLDSYPDRTTTGIPPGTALEIVDGDYRTTENGQVVERLDITGQLYVDHDDVTVKCTRVRKMTTNNGQHLRMWLSTLGDPDGVRQGAALKWSDYTLRRVDVRGTIDGLKGAGDVDVRDSYIHDLYRTADASQDSGTTHNDGVQIRSGSDMAFVHNTFYTWSFTDGERAGENLYKAPFGDGNGYVTSAFIITDAAGPVSDVLIQDNLIRGRSSKPFIVVEKGGHGISGLRIVDNVIGRESRDFPKVFGGGDLATVRGNVFTDGTPAED